MRGLILVGMFCLLTVGAFGMGQGQLVDTAVVGSVEWSFLTPAQFMAQKGNASWVLCDGTVSVAGSKYARISGNTVTPDMRGRFPRMKDNGAGIDTNGDLTLGTAEADQFKSHNHTITNGSVITGSTQATAHAGTSFTTGGVSPIVNFSGGSETQGKAMVINAFCKIN